MRRWNRVAAVMCAGGALLAACHPVCEVETVPQGTRFQATVVAPSVECPEIVPLKAGDVLTIVAGQIGEDGQCRGNASTGLPAEFPLYPESPYRVDKCAAGQVGISVFNCSVTAPDCATGDIQGAGNLDGGLTLDRYPNRGEVLDSELVVTVAVGADLSCRSSCFTKIPVTVERM